MFLQLAIRQQSRENSDKMCDNLYVCIYKYKLCQEQKFNGQLCVHMVLRLPCNEKQ